MYKIKQGPEDFIVDEVLDLPKGEGDYHYYILKKRMLSTENVLQEIATRLGVARRHIGSAGNKDRRAVTTQYISIRGKKVDSLEVGGWSLQYVQSGPRPISIGMNTGNRFTIVVRECSVSPKVLHQAINYFGEQRFGTINVDVGRNLVKKEFDKAAAILKSQEYFGDYTDAIKALRTLPKRLLTLFVHAYQSYLWNKVVEQLVREGKEEEFVEIVGFGTEFTREYVEELYDVVLAEEGVTGRDFIIRQIPDLSSEGSTRKMFGVVSNMIVKVGAAENVYTLTFTLGSGQYATEVLRQSITGTTKRPTP